MTQFGKFAPQAGAEIRVGDADQGFAALAQGLAVQVDGAVLGNHPMYMAAGGDDAGTGG